MSDKSVKEASSDDLNCQKGVNELGKVGAFAPSSSLPEGNMFPDIAILEKSFLNISSNKKPGSDVKEQEDTNANLNLANYAKEENGVDQNCNPSDADDGKSASSAESGDFIVKPAFADCGGDNDLGAFFRECQSAPPLVSFTGQPTLAQSLSDVENQISKYEQGMKEIDEFMESFCNTDLEQ